MDEYMDLLRLIRDNTSDEKQRRIIEIMKSEDPLSGLKKLDVTYFFCNLEVLLMAMYHGLIKFENREIPYLTEPCSGWIAVCMLQTFEPSIPIQTFICQPVQHHRSHQYPKHYSQSKRQNTGQPRKITHRHTRRPIKF